MICVGEDRKKRVRLRVDDTEAEVGLDGVGMCEALDRRESYHRCLAGGLTGLEPALALVAGPSGSNGSTDFWLVAVLRAFRPLRLPLTERNVSRERRPRARPTDPELYDVADVLSREPGVVFSHAEQPPRPGGVTGVGGMLVEILVFKTRKNRRS